MAVVLSVRPGVWDLGRRRFYAESPCFRRAPSCGPGSKPC